MLQGPLPVAVVVKVAPPGWMLQKMLIPRCVHAVPTAKSTLGLVPRIVPRIISAMSDSARKLSSFAPFRQLTELYKCQGDSRRADTSRPAL